MLFRPLFTKEFATQTDDHFIINSLGSISMKPNDNSRDYFSRPVGNN